MVIIVTVSCRRPLLPGASPLETTMIPTALNSFHITRMFQVQLSFVVNLLNVFLVTSKLFFKVSVTIAVAPVITGMTSDHTFQIPHLLYVYTYTTIF